MNLSSMAIQLTSSREKQMVLQPHEVETSSLPLQKKKTSRMTQSTLPLLWVWSYIILYFFKFRFCLFFKTFMLQGSKIICFTENVWWHMMFKEVKVYRIVKSFQWSWRVYHFIHQTISVPNFSAILQCLSDMCGDLYSNFLCNCYTL